MPTKLKKYTCSTVCVLALSQFGLARAQSVNDPAIDITPVQVMKDLNDVDYASGTVRIAENLFSTPGFKNMKSITLNNSSPSYFGIDDPLSVDIIPFFMKYNSTIGNLYSVSTGDTNSSFRQSANGQGYQESYAKAGHTLLVSGATVTFVDQHGTQAVSSGTHYAASYTAPLISNVTYFDTITYADGETLNFYFNRITGHNSIGYSVDFSRPKFAVSNRGYGIQFSYASETYLVNGNVDMNSGWNRLVKVTWYNKSKYYCDESTLVDCSSISSSAQMGSFSSQTLSSAQRGVTIATPFRSLYLIEGAGCDGVQCFQEVMSREIPGVTGSKIEYSYENTTSNDDYARQYDDVISSKSGSLYWKYTTEKDNFSSTVYASDSSNAFSVGHYSITGSDFFGQPSSFQDKLGNIWQYSYDTSGRLSYIAQPEGDALSITRDTRGNITQTSRSPKPGSALAAAVWSASYPATCSIPKTCNKPTYIIDADNNRTDYTYDANGGGVATVTGPAVNSVRPQVRYTYTQRYAWILNSSGSYVRAASPIWVLTQESRCRASAATGTPSAPCAGNDEILTSYDYGPDAGPNNLFVRGKTVQSDGQTFRACYAYDPQGNKISETSPRAALASCP